jgi:PAS domain S-box-containing protein
MSGQDGELLLEHAPVVMRWMPVALARCSADLRYLWVSQRYADWMGMSPQEIIGRTVADFIGEEGMKTLQPHIDAALRGETVEYELQVVLKPLGPRWLHGEYSPTFDASGRPDGWIAVVTDITDRKRAEQQLAANNTALAKLHELSARLTSQDELQTLLDAVVQAAIILTEAKMGTLRLYDAATDTLRIVAHAGFGQPFLDQAAVIRDAEDVCGQAQQERRRILIEDIKTYPGGAAAPGLAALEAAGARAVQATPLVAHDGRLLGVIATYWDRPHRPDASTLRILDLLAREAADLIEHRQREEELLQANRSKDEFLAMLGHELRNPLSPIVTALQILKLRGNGQFAKTLGIVERQVQYLIRLVDDLLDISRITRGQIQIRKHLVRLQDVVAEGAEMAMPLIEQRRHHLNVHMPDAALRLDGDEGRLAQVVANLLTNAAKYTDTGGQIDVEAKQEGTEVVLSVKDNGIGINAELLPHVFDLFTQERQAADRARGGLGIGLTIVRSLVELHGGTVQAKSMGPGRGSEFVVRLPAVLAEPAAVEVHPGAPRAPSHEGRRILVVDDNQDALALLAEVLRDAGHTVQEAVDGPRALDALDTFRPDVAILDIGLPVMDGYELARRIREQLGSGSPVLIALTGYGQESDRARAMNAGFSQHLTKPVEVDCLLGALAAVRPYEHRAQP